MSEYQIGEFIVTEKGQDAFVIELYKTETSDSASPRYSARWVSRVPLTGGTITRTDTILQNIELKCPDELIIDNLKVLALEPFRHHGYYYK